MAINKAEIKIDYKCNNCGTVIADKYIKDKVKGVGWKCQNCYNEFYKAARSIRAGRYPVSKSALKILEYLARCEKEGNSDNEYHTVTSLSNELGMNYHSTLRAVRLIEALNLGFFSEYDISIKKLRDSKSRSAKARMEVLTVKKREDCKENR